MTPMTETVAHKMLIKKITANGNTWVLNLPKMFLRPLGYGPGKYVQVTVLPDNSLHVRLVQEEVYDIQRIR